MSRTIMRQQQGCLHYDTALEQSFMKGLTEPLYLNYRCEARQVMAMPVNKRIWPLSAVTETGDLIKLLH